MYFFSAATFSIAFLLLNCSFGNVNGAESPKCANKATIVKDLLKSYDKNKIPSATGPLTIAVSLQFDDGIELPDSQGPMDVDIFVRQSWKDAALRFEMFNPCTVNISLDGEQAEQIWTPDGEFLTYGEFEPGMAMPITPIVLSKPLIILHYDGTVLRYERLRVKAFCVNVGNNFPFVAKSCTLIYGSLAHNKDEIVLKKSINSESPIAEASNAEQFMRYKAEEWNMDTPNGLSSTIKIDFSLGKNLRKLFLMFYIPSALIVAISWLSFLLGPMVIVRAVTVVGSLLLLFIHFGFQSTRFPKSDTFTAMDAWMLICIAFIFSAIFELVIVSCMTSTRRPRRSARGKCPCLGRRDTYTTVPVIHSSAASDPLYEELNMQKNERNINQQTCTCCRVCALSIDFISFIVFPILFVLFNIIYFTALHQLMPLFHIF